MYFRPETYSIVQLNLSLFIARKIAFSRKRSFSSVIIRIAIAAIAISISVMILTAGIIDGFRNGISDKIFGFWGHINIAHVGVQANVENIPIDASPDYAAILDTLGRIPYYASDLAAKNGRESLTSGGVKYIQSYTLLPGIIKTKQSLEGIILKGTGPDFHWEEMEKYLIDGHLPEIKEDKVSTDILISSITAKRLELSVGDKIIIHFIQGNDQLNRRFTVGGIYKTGLDEYDNKLALTDMRRLNQILGWEENKVGGFEVFLDDLNDLDVFNEYIYLELLPTDIYSETIKRKFSQIFDWLEFTGLNERVVFILMIVVSVINMITALLIFILERTNMIGVLNAMGMQHWNLRKIFLYHAAYIIIFGLLIGNVIGIGLGYLQLKFEFLKLEESSYYLSVVPIQFNYLKILFINIGTLLLIICCLILPTFLISRIDPVKAIRFS